MAVAGRHAAMPADRLGTLGDPDGPADATHGPSLALPLLRAPRGAAWIHQEDASYAGIGPRNGT